MTLTTISGLPAHALLVHAMVVLAPLTALLEILCALWPAARRRLVWLVLAFAGGITVLTPITANAGGWLYDRERHHCAILNTHAERGGWMIYFSVAMLVVAVVLALMHWREGRSANPGQSQPGGCRPRDRGRRGLHRAGGPYRRRRRPVGVGQ